MTPRAEFDFKLGRKEGEVIKINDRTVIVRFEVKSQPIEIKRHIDKHNVEFIKVV